MAEEYLDILDEQGNKTGESKPYNEAHEKGLRHAAVHVWVVTPDNRIILQKRAANKILFPSYWDISVGGHVSAGQTSLEAAIRETEEELGLNFKESDFALLFTLQTNNDLNNGFIDREFNNIYLVRADVEESNLKFTDGEVEEVKFLTVPEFKDWINGKGEKMVPHAEYEKLVEYLEK
jgi:isopentenyl-diphosphate delta-isomerase